MKQTSRNQLSKPLKFRYTKNGHAFNLIVLGSSSAGNAYYLDRLLIDVGVAFSKIKPLLHMVDVIFITHEHGDHIKPDVLKSIIKWKRDRNQKLRIVTNGSVIDKLEAAGVMYSYEEVKSFAYNWRGLEYNFQTVKAEHSVECYGLFCRITHTGGRVTTFLHMTDTKLVPTIKGFKIDICVLEANYKPATFWAMVGKLKSQGRGKEVNYHSLEHYPTVKFDRTVADICHDKSLILEAHQSSSNREPNEGLIISYMQVIERMENK